MKSWVSLFYLFLIGSNSFAQRFDIPQTNLLVGSNYSTLVVNDTALKPGTSLSLGTQLLFFQNHKLGLSINLFYQDKRSWYSSNTIISQRNFDLQPAIKWSFGDFAFYSGLSFSSQGSFAIRTKGDGQRAFILDKELKGENEFNYLLGLDFKLNEKGSAKLFMNYTVPSRPIYTRNVSLGLSFPINQKDESWSEQHVKVSERQARAYRTIKEIKQLKEGVLLIRLQTLKPSIEALRKAGFEEDALKLEKQQHEFNKNLVSALRQLYRFSEIRFFYSYHSQKVIDDDFEGIFLNSKLEEDSSIKIDASKPMFTAAFKQIERDTAAHIDYISYTSGARSIEEVHYHGGPDFNFNALVVMDHEFNQLYRPFPYYTRFWTLNFKRQKTARILLFPFLPRYEKTFENGVSLFNRKLFRYYNKYY